MKKYMWIFGVTCLLLTLASVTIFAEQSGWSFTMGQESWVTEMEMTSDEVMLIEAPDYWDPETRTYISYNRWFLSEMEERTSLNRLFLKANYSFSDKGNIYAKVGTARLYPEMKWMKSRAGSDRYTRPSTDDEWELDRSYYNWYEGSELGDYWWWLPVDPLGYKDADSGSAYGIGGNYTFKTTPNYAIIGNFEYLLQENNNIGNSKYAYERTIDGNPDTLDSYIVEHTKAKTTQLTVSVMTRGRVGKLYPYIGARYVQLESVREGSGTYREVDYDSTDGSVISDNSNTVDFDYTMQNRDEFGLFGGLEYMFDDKLSGDISVIIQGDWGVSAGLTWKL